MSRAMVLVSETLSFFKKNIGFSFGEIFFYFVWWISASIIFLPLLFIGFLGKFLYVIILVAVIALKSSHVFSQIVRKAAGVDVSGKFTDKAILARSGKVFLFFLILAFAWSLVLLMITFMYGFVSGPNGAVANAVNDGDWLVVYEDMTSNLGLHFILMVVMSFGYALVSSKITALSLDHDRDNEVLEKDKVIDFAAALLAFYVVYTLLAFVIFVLFEFVGYFALPLFIVLAFAFSVIFPALHGVRCRLARDEDSGSDGMAVLPNEGM